MQRLAFNGKLNFIRVGRGLPERTAFTKFRTYIKGINVKGETAKTTPVYCKYWLT